MTGAGLNELKELAAEVGELRDRVGKQMVRLTTLYLEDEDVETLGAHNGLTKATVFMQNAAWRLGQAVTKLQGCYKAEKALMDFYDGLLNKEDNDEEEPREA